MPHGTVADAFLVPATTADGPRVFIVAAGRRGRAHLTAQIVVDGDTEATRSNWPASRSARTDAAVRQP